jgi:5-methylcytosine-specific restriction enzyme subunit McrC
VAQTRLPATSGELLWQRYSRQVAVEFPSPRTAQQWRLTAQGWVGHIPLAPDLWLLLQPKVALANLFRMLEVAYDQPLLPVPGVVATGSLSDFFERLAHHLARRISERVRHGLLRGYQPHHARLPYLRGRLDLGRTLRQPPGAGLVCDYETHTTDIEDNRILLYTLWLLSRTARRVEVRQTVSQAYLALRGQVSLLPVAAAACLDRPYNRLTEDYRPLHALCYFFLDHLGPDHRPGERQSLPFLVNMAGLYERFVAVWLAAYLPSGLSLKSQARVNNPDVRARVDMVLTDTGHDHPWAVLDTKYKTPAQPAEADIYQVVAYAQDRRCHEAILVYPAPLPRPLDTRWGDVHVRSLTFALHGDLDAAGHTFLQQLLAV